MHEIRRPTWRRATSSPRIAPKAPPARISSGPWRPGYTRLKLTIEAKRTNTGRRLGHTAPRANALAKDVAACPLGNDGTRGLTPSTIIATRWRNDRRRAKYAFAGFSATNPARPRAGARSASDC